ncbi:MAG: NosD domain-containing protein [Candidatus Anstonellales archaeon]
MKKFLILVFFVFGLVYSITSCQEITGNNLNLYLENSIDANSAECIIIEGTNINLDCNGYTIYNASTGIVVRASKNVSVLNCNIQNSTTGILFTKIKAANVSIQNMTFLQDGTGGLIQNASITNTSTGIEIHLDSGNKIQFSTIKNSQTGISLKTSLFTLIENSTIQSNTVGVLINNSVKFNDPENYPERNYGNNTLRNNYIINNNIGIRIYYSGKNSFYNNYFNNTNNVNSNSLSLIYLYNFWNSSYDCSQPSIIGGRCRGGNFYNDYTGYDSGEGIHPHNESFDGIGDTSLPYMPYGETVGDTLPLTKNVPPNWIVECRNITSMGSYVIKKNIYGVMSETDHRCLNILAPNVEINCYGYSLIDNTTYNDTYGIYVNGYSNLILKNCSIINYTTGLYEFGSTYGTLVGNNFSNDVYNIYLDYYVDDTPQISIFFKNITTDNYVDGKRVYYFLNGKTGDGYTPPAPTNAGLIGYVNTNNAYITGQELSKNSPVVLLVNVTNGLAEKNRIDRVGDGVYIYLSRNISVMDNNFTNIARYTVGISFSNTTNISKNRIENGSTSVTSIYAYRSNNVTMSYNNASNLRSFLAIEDSSGYADVFNNIGYVKYRGCAMVDTPGGRVYRNTFIGTEYSPNLILAAGFYSGQIFNNTLLGYAQRLAGIIVWPGDLVDYNISIYNNTIIGNETNFSYDSLGIRIDAMNYNVSIYRNTIKNVRWGINPRMVASNLSIFNNTIYNTSIGMQFDIGCTCNAPFPRCIDVHSNNISIFASYAIYVSALPPSCSRVFYNNYIYNLGGGWAYGDSDTYWNTSYNCSRGPNIIGGQCWGGNSWNPTGLCDFDGDGISEMPFFFFGGTDELPLTNNPCKSKSIKIEIKDKNTTVELPTQIKIKR